MAYDERLAERVRRAMPAGAPLTEKRMFGGLTFMVNGVMCCGVLKDQLVVRVGKAGHDEAVAQPHARPMDFTGRPMRGFVYVKPEGLRTARALKAWIQRGLDGKTS
jgi:TfoX/Sxy family transcriptional regulator of competence genes